MVLHLTDFIAIIVLIIRGVQSCLPAQVGQPYETDFNVSSTVNKWILKKNNDVLYECDLSRGCTSQLPTKSVNLTFIKHATFTMFKFQIGNVTEQNIEGRYTLEAHDFGATDKVKDFCDLEIFEKINAQCSTEFIPNGLKITCKVQRGYPKTEMNVKINDDTFSGDCYFEESESFYYNSTCSYTISRYQILQGNNELTIVLYPNISGTHSAKRYKQEVHFKIERPIISIKSCTGLTSDGILTCLYQRLDQSDVTTVIESNVDLLYQNQTHIELQMYHGMREIKIWAQNVFGIRSKIEKMYIPSSDEVKRMPTSSEKENDGKSNNILIIICCIVIVIHVVLLFQTKGRKVWRKIRNFKVWTRTVGQDQGAAETLIPNDYSDDSQIRFRGKRTASGVFTPGNYEAEMSYGGEADLHKHVTGCKKNPGHKGFIPLKDFNASCLPSSYHDDDLMCKTIKALAALTVQVKTKFTSLERPEFYPETEVPYPWYNDRGSHVMRLGTGRVWRVDKYTESDGDGTCRCAKCQVSATPSKVWGKVYVLTATHVVFDDSEARQTSCVLGFDDNKSPVVSLDEWKVMGGANIEGDTCVLRYVTCDLELIDELDKMCQRFVDLCVEVRNKYRRFVDVDKLTVIVSHPHGLPKQVSVGQWTHKHERDDIFNTYTRYWYTTCTCPGSAGAYVYMPGSNPRIRGLVHSGSNSGGNYSGESFDFF